MIGNDVVDLQLAAQQSNWRRKGFLKKVFSRTELEMITTAQDSNEMVWLLWSMKEAAYKAHQRKLELPRRINWLIQECRLTNLSSTFASGEVHIEGNIYKTASEIASAYIHTSAEKFNERSVKNVIFDTSSSEAKKSFLYELSKFFKVPLQELQLEKDALGMPFVTRKNTFFFNRFSLSGHGRFYAYSLSLINCETAVKQS